MKFFLPAFLYLSILPHTSSPQPDSNFIGKFNRGKNYFSYNQTKEAFLIFQELYKKQPSNSNINYLLGICYTEEEPNSEKSIFHLEKAIKDVSTDYDAGSFHEKRTPIFVYYYLTIAYSQHGKCEKSKQAKNYFHTLYGIEKNDYYISDAEKWVKKCNENSKPDNKPAINFVNRTEDSLVTKNIDFTTTNPLFGVQVGAFSRLVPIYEFAGLSNVEAFLDKEGMVRYVIGNFILRHQAENLLKTVQEAGYKDAFIVDVNKEKKFSEQPVIVKDVSLYKSSFEKVNFKIQLGVFSETIPDNIAKIYLQLDGIEEKNENGVTVLSIGNFSSYEEAEKFKEKIISTGIPDAFIVAFCENKKIDVKLARNYYHLKTKN